MIPGFAILILLQAASNQVGSNLAPYPAARLLVKGLGKLGFGLRKFTCLQMIEPAIVRRHATRLDCDDLGGRKATLCFCGRRAEDYSLSIVVENLALHRDSTGNRRALEDDSVDVLRLSCG